MSSPPEVANCWLATFATDVARELSPAEPVPACSVALVSVLATAIVPAVVPELSKKSSPEVELGL